MTLGRGFFERSRGLLEALEAGVSMVVRQWVIGMERLPWPAAVHAVRVSPRRHGPSGQAKP
ncbi:hypothetical protein [Mycobacteroides abscessus]|uniref:hypothetical protein n=1 Tax=Mycobacteroides abscessus TaxID=36809 RepID=UPI0002685C30|nr:hypothetical protein [Mycobacteroides abscessus]EIV65531.1 hypothetical protein MMCCUG48898_4449 [Mycobacteroides abscessus subsp. massiliense CCUG 48898 = JCM 15300]BAP99192.1 hypothetical protein MMASJCM_4416 [Mycobacteroides abscessus subsp. massiliense CCUG 48898 = JCM 15300]